MSVRSGRAGRHEYYYSDDAEGLVHVWLSVGHEKTVLRCVRVRYHEFERFGWDNVFITSELNLNQLWDDWNAAKDDFPSFRAQQRFRLALGMVCGRLLDEPASLTRREFHQATMDMIRLRIQETFHQGIDVGRLAKLAGYSRFHFARLFKACVGCTIHEYVTACRLVEMERLRRGGCAQKEISRALGFSHPSAYLNWRKKATGTGTHSMLSRELFLTGK